MSQSIKNSSSAEMAMGAQSVSSVVKQVTSRPGLTVAILVLLLMCLTCFTYGFGTAGDPSRINPSMKLLPPSSSNWLGTDSLGRDIYGRVVQGGQVSIQIGALVSVISIFVGTVIGLTAGYIRWLDSIVMRIMDGLMAIPSILLAIAFVALLGSGFFTVITALVLPEIPRVVRLVRSVVLSVREEPYIEAAIIGGTSLPKILYHHVLPNTIAPLVVIATYIAAAAVLLEASLSFLGAGIPPETPSWGNVVASGRAFFEIAPWIIFAPSVVLAITVLSINIIGDGMREILDPRFAKSM